MSIAERNDDVQCQKEAMDESIQLSGPVQEAAQKTSKKTVKVVKKVAKAVDPNAGVSKVNKYCRNNGYNKTKFLVEMGKSSPKNVTSAKDCGWALERMYRNTAISKKRSKQMIKLLKAQTRRGKIPAGIPEGVTVANKTGETTFAENDAAIVYSNGADYIIVVMSKNGKNSVSQIQKISKITYEWFN